MIFVGVCDHLADWKKMDALFGGEPPAFPVARDAKPPTGSRVPLGATAAAYGVRLWPTTVVIDRAGRVRAAGLRDEQLRGVIDKLMDEPLEAAPLPNTRPQPGE